MIPNGLAEGITEPAMINHNPQLMKVDIHAPLAHAADLGHGSVWKTDTRE